MPTIITRGAGSAQGLGYASSSAPVTYIEDVFSTYLYTGNGSTQTITNGIDLSGKGGLVWNKKRSTTQNHYLTNTAQGAAKQGNTNNSNVFSSNADVVTAFLSSGFSVGSTEVNDSAATYASWTFRKQPKFFDVVTWTGSNDSGTNIGKGIVSHNLGSAPGCVIVKNTTSNSTDWIVYHRSLSGGYRALLNTTDAQTNSGSVSYFSKYTTGVGWAQTDPDANNIYVGYNYQTNDNGATMVAYLFAHDAGGFGLTGTDNVISCGSYTTNASAKATINLGYEAQWVLVKRSSGADGWYLMDTMRGFAYSNTALGLQAQSNQDESAMSSGANGVYPTATGFEDNGTFASNSTFIYIAIRRGPMKVPTSGTSVFLPAIRAGTGATATTTNLSFPVDTVWSKGRDNGGTNSGDFDRLRGATQQLSLNQSDTETTASTSLTGFDVMTGYTAGADAVQLTINATGYNYVNWNFRRAPGFFDVVCYTGTGVARTVTHNLAAAPEFIQVKSRSHANGWAGYSAPTGNTKRINFADVDSAQVSLNAWNNTSPTSSVFTVGTDNSVNGSARTYVAYLFATVAGVSKVGSYTGNGTTQTIDCGFGAGGVRFVLIKRTDSTGNWYVYDTARGMTALTDPYLLLDTTAAEVATLGSVTTVSTGFSLNSAILAAINVNAGTYIFLAIA